MTVPRVRQCDETLDDLLVKQSTPSVWRVHLALIVCQCIFAGGSVVGKLGVSTFNPMIFALIRECSAGVLLLGIAVYREGWQLPKQKDALVFLACGFFIFTNQDPHRISPRSTHPIPSRYTVSHPTTSRLTPPYLIPPRPISSHPVPFLFPLKPPPCYNQACFILGDKLAGAVLASAWQPTQPVFTLIISLCLGWEAFTPGKAVGIFLSFGGAAFMVAYGGDFSSTGAEHALAGNALLFCNCLGTSLYVIFGKFALGRGYTAFFVTAWSYLCGAVMMLAVASGFSSSCDLVQFICPVEKRTIKFICNGHQTSCDPWAVPTEAIAPLCYWVFFNSIAAYLLMTWGNQYAKAGFVLAYCALQPLGAMTLSAIIISVVGDGTDLTMPGLNSLGAIPILLGLGMILFEGRQQHEKDAEEPMSLPHPELRPDYEAPNPARSNLQRGT
eukprot:CAMPEP_0181192736 /NCGR_PEP_ID=MMETSP1096-20121128/13442_1 /TAXON_ID=156174 ORGANISM="Chrysochromulina ericina, Strain CCMP281" /NCGR_SAMPLE_ID=MMETSP1096 /ASSEMBLY_ACC=CAM_ASM_000453 /LENGTH=441 /DNA_ID=CAMNT_0023282151 /DNA_START=68 /DNA_END=1393 /DNA_ORIENTATION=-